VRRGRGGYRRVHEGMRKLGSPAIYKLDLPVKEKCLGGRKKEREKVTWIVGDAAGALL